MRDIYFEVVIIYGYNVTNVRKSTPEFSNRYRILKNLNTPYFNTKN